MISSFGRGFDSLQLHKLKSKAAVFSVALLFVYLNTFSFQKTFYNISISSLDNPVACEMTSIATSNFFKLRALSFTPSL